MREVELCSWQEGRDLPPGEERGLPGRDAGDKGSLTHLPFPVAPVLSVRKKADSSAEREDGEEMLEV